MTREVSNCRRCRTSGVVEFGTHDDRYSIKLPEGWATLTLDYRDGRKRLGTILCPDCASLAEKRIIEP